MRIGIDGYGAVCRRDEGRLRLIEELAEAAQGDSFIVYVPELKSDARLQRLRTRGNVELRVPAPQSFHGSMWRWFGIPTHLHADRVDVYLGLDGRLPLNIESARVPAVMALPDATGLFHPELTGKVRHMAWLWALRRSCRAAKRVVVATEAARETLAARCGIDREAVAVIPPLYVSAKAGEADKTPAGKLPERFIILIDTPEHGDNAETALKALRNISPDTSLVVWGAGRAARRRLEGLSKEMEIERRVVFAEDIGSAGLVTLCRSAEVALSLSERDSAVPDMLAALGAGVPLIAASGDGREETGGPDTIYVGPHDADEVAECVHAILSDPLSARSMGDAGRVYVDRNRPAVVAPAWLSLLRSLL